MQSIFFIFFRCGKLSAFLYIYIKQTNHTKRVYSAGFAAGANF